MIWKFLMKIYSLEIFPFEDLFLEIFSWRFFLEIFPLDFWNFLRRFVHGDFSFEIWFWRFFLLKICSWRFFLENLFWRLNFWKKFNEDLFMEIFPWRFILRDFSIEVLEIFMEDFFIGVFSFEKWRIFILKMEIFFMITKWRRWRWTRNDEDLFMRQEW